MFCPKCNKEVNNGKLFCNVCGSRLVEKDAEITNNEIIDVSNGTTQIIDVPSMVKSYVGDSYDKIRATNFSIWYFLFGVFYAIYRKMYLFGSIYLVSYIALAYTIPKLGYILSVVINIVISLIFNNMYLLSIEKRVKRIREKNQGLNRSELLKLCKNLGGVNYLLSLFALIIVFVVNYNINKDLINEVMNKMIGVPIENYQDLEFNNPSVFGKKEVLENKYTYNYETDKDSCNYTIEIISTPNTAYNYLNRKTDYSEKDKVSPITEQSINGMVWNYMEIDTIGTAYVYDYAIINNHLLYNVTYKIYEDSGICRKLKDELINSLQFSNNDK